MSVVEGNAKTVAQLAVLPAQPAYFIDYLESLKFGFDIGGGKTFTAWAIQKRIMQRTFDQLKKQFSHLDWQLLTLEQLTATVPAGGTPLVVIGSIGQGVAKEVRANYPQARVIIWY